MERVPVLNGGAESFGVPGSGCKVEVESGMEAVLANKSARVS